MCFESHFFKLSADIIRILKIPQSWGVFGSEIVPWLDLTLRKAEVVRVQEKAPDSLCAAAELQPAQRAEQKTIKPHAADYAFHSPSFANCKARKEGGRQHN